MKRTVFVLIVLAVIFLPFSAFAASGPQVVNRDGLISVSANQITLGRLLNLWDKATGTTSKVPPELADRTLSVQFTGLSEDDAVRAIFRGQPFGYAFVRGEGIIVTSPAPSSKVTEAQPQPLPAVAPPDAGPVLATPEMQNPEIQRMKPQAVPEQPMTITPSPFGAIVSPAGTEPPMVQLPPIPGAPPPPPFFRPDVAPAPYSTPYSPAPYGPAHDMLYAPPPVQP